MITKPDTLSRDQIRRVDELAVSDLKIPSIVLMENAAKNTAGWIRSRYAGLKGIVHVFCGTGNNGGDGLAIARHLHNAGWRVYVGLIGRPEKLSPDAATNFAIVQAMGIPFVIHADLNNIESFCSDITGQDLIVDAMLGTGFSGEARAPYDGIIRAINAAQAKAVIAVDVPSGLDCDTGEVGNVAVEADVTVTFVATKRGFRVDSAAGYVGEIVVVDIGAPSSLIERVLT